MKHPIRNQRTWRFHAEREARITYAGNNIENLRMEVHYLTDDEELLPPPKQLNGKEDEGAYNSHTEDADLIVQGTAGTANPPRNLNHRHAQLEPKDQPHLTLYNEIAAELDHDANAENNTQILNNVGQMRQGFLTETEIFGNREDLMAGIETLDTIDLMEIDDEVDPADVTMDEPDDTILPDFEHIYGVPGYEYVRVDGNN